MIKKIVSASVVMAAVFMLIGCGGGGSTSSTATGDGSTPTLTTDTVIGDTTTTTGGTTTVATRTGTGYYVDSAISGVTFLCGTSSGVTDENGTFTFTFNADDAGDEVCTFTLNGLLLRTLNEGDIEEEESIFEDVILIAQLLQTLDSDGNASNGITISPEVITYLSENDFTVLPSSSDEIEILFDDLNSSVPSYEGNFVTEEEVEEHLEETRQSLDQTAPVITVIGDAVMTLAHGSSFADPGVTVTDDYYAESEINVTVAGSVDTAVVGNYTLTYTAEDGAGNSASETRTVNVTDQTVPIITVSNADITIEVGSAFTEADALNGVSASDVVDGSVSVSADISSVNSALIGDYTVTYTATDAANNSVTATAMVHVTDTTVPSITLNGNDPDTVEVSQGSTYTDLGAVVTDNSSETILAEVTGTVDTTSVGSYTLTYTGTDSTGNVNSVSRTVNVVDNTIPVITLKGNASMTVAHGSTFSDPGTTVVDNSGESLSASVSGSVDTNTVGIYTLTYTVTDSSTNAAASVTRTVTVTDQTAPSITVSNTNITIEVASTFTEVDALNGVSASDVVDGSVRVSANINLVNSALIGDYTVTYTATDDAGNSVTATATVHVTDTTIPSIALNGDDPDSVEVAQGSTYADLGVTITDNSGETITAIVTGTADTTEVGSYTLMYVARDSSGNENNVSRTVNVVDTTAPVVTVTGANPMNILLNEAYSEEGATVTDNSGESLTASVESNNVDTSVMGEYAVVYLATDNAGNEGRASRVVHVTSGQPPVITVSGEEALVLEVNQTATYTDPGASATDEEDITVDVEIDATAVNMQEIGTYTVTFTATDSNGNTVTATRTVNVVDTTKPVITIKGDNPLSIVINDGEAFIDPGTNVTDNSGESLDVTVDNDLFSASPGTYLLTYSATDTSGNTGTATRTVNVLDTTAPVITLDGDNPYIVEIATTYSDPGVTATDAVDEDVSVDINTTALDMTTLGLYTVTYTAKDSAGNEATASRDVNVTDTTAPELTLNGSATVNILLNETYTEENATVTDNSGELLSVEINGDVDTSSLGTYSVNYSATDSSGNTGGTQRTVNVVDEVILQANPDFVEPDTIGEEIISVLDNDDIPSDVTIFSLVLIAYNEYGALSFESGPVERPEGNWTVVDNTVVFTPNLGYGGGQVDIEYQIEDSTGAKSQSWVGIGYPVFVQAMNDYNQTDTSDPFTVEVLANDNVAEVSTVTIQLANYDDNGNRYFTSDPVESWDGIWTVVDDTVVFAPNQNFAGGSAWIEYQISDPEGHRSAAGIEIMYPMFVYAEWDPVQAAIEGAVVTVDVLANDQWGEDITPVVMLGSYDEQQNLSFTLEDVVLYDGIWNIEENQSVTFTPNENFNSRYAQIEYQLSDEDGHTSQTWIMIEYPVSIYAEQDHVQKTAIETVNIDVVANDTNLSAVTVLFEVFTPNGTEYVLTVESFSGNWNVEDNQSVTFTPNVNFGGGPVDMWYQITDEEGRTATSWIHIDYPVYVYAEWDQVLMNTIDPVTVNVLENDTNTSAVSILLINRNWETGTEDIAENIVTQQGEWNIVGDTVTFHPNTDTGGSVYMEYQIADDAGHISRSAIEIIYPIGPSDVCIAAPQTELSDLDAIYAAVSDNVGFKDENGRRYFATRLDTDIYTISDELFGTLTVIDIPLNPMYFVGYEDENQTSYVRAKLETGEITLYENNNTWSYQEERVENNNGTKSIQTGGETGEYSTDDNNTNNLTIGGQSVFTFKAVRTISNDEIITMIGSDINLTSTVANTAQLIVTKTMETRYWWNDQSWDSNTYASLQDYITSKAYDSNLENLHEGVLHTQSGGKTIIFAEGSTGDAGDLVEVAYSGNEFLTGDAGTWSIITLQDEEGNDYNALLLEPILCGYEKALYRLDSNGNIIQGGFDEVAGDIGAEIMFSEGLKDELKAFFIEKAILDVDPSLGE